MNVIVSRYDQCFSEFSYSQPHKSVLYASTYVIILYAQQSATHSLPIRTLRVEGDVTGQIHELILLILVRFKEKYLEGAETVKLLSNTCWAQGTYACNLPNALLIDLAQSISYYLLTCYIGQFKR